MLMHSNIDLEVWFTVFIVDGARLAFPAASNDTHYANDKAKDIFGFV